MSSDRSHAVFRRVFQALVGVLLALVLGAAAVAGYTWYLLEFSDEDLPDVRLLREDRPAVTSYVYAADGSVIGEFATEQHRREVPYDEISGELRRAIMAAEDKDFLTHRGFDVLGIFRAAMKNVEAGRIVAGGSTITQQLAKLVFFSAERSFERKLMELRTARAIERNYSKKEIFVFYANLAYFGHGQYGVAAAARYYFDKNLAELTVAECALLAGLISSPAKFSPIDHPNTALVRRDGILTAMYRVGFIAESTLAEAKEENISLGTHRNDVPTAPYFVEAVRKALKMDFSEDEVWSDGLRVTTTLDAKLVATATDALRDGLRTYDKRHLWRGVLYNVTDSRLGLTAWHTPADWGAGIPTKAEDAIGVIRSGIVKSVTSDEAVIRLIDYTATLSREGAAWVKGAPKSKPREAWLKDGDLRELFRSGDVALFKIEALDSSVKTALVSLEQDPLIQGAVVVIENATGAVRAMVGGFDYSLSKFDRALQALRQAGSAFKPIVYAAAFESGTFLLDDAIRDAPISFNAGAGKPRWAPKNYDGEFRGTISVRRALAESRNVPAIRVANEVGIKDVIGLAHRLGISSELAPYLPTAIGASDVMLMEIAAAYSVFPNGGVLRTPYFLERVLDRDGKERFAHAPSESRAVSPEVAATMVEALRGPVLYSHGTARKAAKLLQPVAGKTGTTNDFSDAWFIGFTPSYTIGVWCGFDDRKTLGAKETGGAVALPIFMKIVEEVYRDRPVEPFPESVEASVAEALARDFSVVSRAKDPESIPTVKDAPLPDMTKGPVFKLHD
ncbi:MAG: PBP1A family penicillin-binding protein [Patescibacteria group bacterium]